jgi:hypothetical protein
MHPQNSYHLLYATKSQTLTTLCSYHTHAAALGGCVEAFLIVLLKLLVHSSLTLNREVSPPPANQPRHYNCHENVQPNPLGHEHMLRMSCLEVEESRAEQSLFVWVSHCWSMSMNS